MYYYNKWVYIIAVIIMFGFNPKDSFAQKSEEEYKKEIDTYKNEIREKADLFLQSNRPVQERLDAIKNYSSIYDENQIEGFKNIVYSDNEPDEIRAAALKMLDGYVEQDAKLFDFVGKAVVNRDFPQSLRYEAMQIFNRISFNSFGMHGGKDLIVSTYRELVNDPEIEFRREGFGYLIQNGDDVAQQLLARGLENPEEALLPPVECISLLAFDTPSDYQPLIFDYLKKENNYEVRVEAVRALGNYTPAREELIKILQDEEEIADFRLVVIGILNANYPDQFHQYTLPLLEDNTQTPADLIMYTIQAEMYRRNDNQSRNKRLDGGRYVPDKFDQLVLAKKDNDSPEISNIAIRYTKTLNFE
ncbi:MAG: HEAT repeat domain-containing protein [Bacteroidota bacterium]